MTWRLDPPIRVGHRVFAALTEVETAAHDVGLMVLASARKWSRTILMLEGSTVTALELDGQVLTPQDTARKFPEAVAQLRALQKEAHDSLPAASPSAAQDQSIE